MGFWASTCELVFCLDFFFNLEDRKIDYFYRSIIFFLSNQCLEQKLCLKQGTGGNTKYSKFKF